MSKSKEDIELECIYWFLDAVMDYVALMHLTLRKEI